MTTPNTATGSRMRGLTPVLRRSGIVGPFVILFVILAVASSSFLTKDNLLNLVDQQASVLIIAAAGTLVVIARGLDLSVGAVYALSSVVTARLAIHDPVIFALFVGLAIGAFVGLINGFLTAVLGINALIVTLAMSFVVTGTAALLTGGNSITLYSRQSYGDLANTSILGVNSSTWAALVAVVIIGLVLWRTTLGRRVYAVGGNPNAAALSGVRVTAVRIGTFVLSGTAAALGGLIDSSRVFSAQSSNGGDTLTFSVLAGIVVGGTSILGGEGAVWRTFAGVMFLALIANGYNLLGLNPLYQQITLGALIIIAVGTGPAAQALGEFRLRSRTVTRPGTSPARPEPAVSEVPVKTESEA